MYDLALTEKVETCLSEEVVIEYLEVLNKDKFSRFASFKTKAQVVLNKLREIATFYKTD
ncbi:hypothetical protein GCM10023189_39240 [Nibrella saemangeumensis]|uniref:Uncharacterized protein n=1 Tax=Nibrella saemangeumensis TaxID=1084526 RepID=A0ABP8NAC2_9BACT